MYPETALILPRPATSEYDEGKSGRRPADTATTSCGCSFPGANATGATLDAQMPVWQVLWPDAWGRFPGEEGHLDLPPQPFL